MAKYQYRIYGVLPGVSSPANAVLALVNRQGSGKRITLRQMVVRPVRQTDVALGYAMALARLVYCSVGEGKALSTVAMDSDATWPSGVSVGTGGPISGINRIVGSHYVGEQYVATGLSGMVRNKTGGGKFITMKPSARRGAGVSSVERLVIRPGESIAMTLTWFNRPLFARLSLTIKVRGTPDRTFMVSGGVFANMLEQAVFSISNNSASDVVELMEFGIEEHGEGSTSTPFFQLVPISAANPAVAGNATNALAIAKMDSASPDPSSWLSAITDSPVTALGVPDEYIAQGSLMSPKGFNYLGTKDYVGPVLRTLFPEIDGFKRSSNAHQVGSPSDWFASVAPQKSLDLLVQKAGITLREGDGIALVPAVETAVSAVNPLSCGSQRPFEYSLTFDVENASQPYLTINDMVAGTDIVVLEAGTSNIVQQIDSYSGTVWSWAYDQDALPYADVVLYKPGYIARPFRNVQLGSVGASIIASQQADRNYA